MYLNCAAVRFEEEDFYIKRLNRRTDKKEKRKQRCNAIKLD